MNITDPIKHDQNTVSTLILFYYLDKLGPGLVSILGLVATRTFHRLAGQPAQLLDNERNKCNGSAKHYTFKDRKIVSRKVPQNNT